MILQSTDQSVSRSDGGSAPRDDLYSSERQRRPGHLDEPQRQIPSEDPSLDSHREKTTGTSGVLPLWLCCSWNNYWFVWPEGNCPPTEPGFSQGFFSILSPMEFWFLAVVASGLLSGDTSFPAYHRLDCTILFKLNWAGRCHHWIQ